MHRYSSSRGFVELTNERLQHIISFHPEVKLFVRYFAETLAKPDTIRHSSTDAKVFIYYKLLRKDKYLAIVIKINERNFILTAYTTTKIKYKP